MLAAAAAFAAQLSSGVALQAPRPGLPPGLPMLGGFAGGLATPSLVAPVEDVSEAVIINDADPHTRFTLTKRSTQDEISRETQCVISTRRER